MVSAGLQLNERFCASLFSFFLFFSSLFSSCAVMTVPIFSERVWFSRLPTASSIPLQRFDVRCDWLSLIYRRPGSVNFKLTDKESTATIRTHRFFPPICRRCSSFSPKMAITQQSFKSVLAGGHKRLVVWKLSSDYFSFFFISLCLYPSNRYWIYIQVTLFYPPLLSCNRKGINHREFESGMKKLHGTHVDVVVESWRKLLCRLSRRRAKRRRNKSKNRIGNTVVSFLLMKPQYYIISSSEFGHR